VLFINYPWHSSAGGAMALRALCWAKPDCIKDYDLSTLPKDTASRLAALREQLQRDGLDGFIIPLTDEHMSEYVGEYAQRLSWISGFGGSAGTAVVTRDKAAIFVDGRYTLQVRAQVDGAHWSYESLSANSIADYLGQHIGAGERIGYDPWLHTRAGVEQICTALAANGAHAVAVAHNPVDAIWLDRPTPSTNPAFPHEERYAGQSSQAKLADIARWLSARKADAVVLSALDSIAWTLNIRGHDVARTPVALCYAIVDANAHVDLFIAVEKVDEALRAHLGKAVTIRARDDFANALMQDYSGKTVAVDPERAVAAIFTALETGGSHVLAVRDPAVLAKACKNATEIAGHKAAQLRDGAALTRFLHWIAQEGPKGTQSELSAAARLETFRTETGALIDLSFDTISGAGPNGAIVHYRVEESTNRLIAPDMLYLVDSGGQYRDGTTDVTRTIAIGIPGTEMRDRFTLVLKGHIALATALFPAGTRGSQLDILARHALWQQGLDYAHGTGHGVGSFLSVHEGPQRIAAFGGGDEPLKAGMILSNEPGYYKTGEYGIRIENLVLVVERTVEGAEKPMLGFETLTFAPIDRALVNVDLLNQQERDWLNAYHSQVLALIAPQLSGDTADWLTQACAAI
jgi:Xaa-Pro aminopeptidase